MSWAAEEDEQQNREEDDPWKPDEDANAWKHGSPSPREVGLSGGDTENAKSGGDTVTIVTTDKMGQTVMQQTRTRAISTNFVIDATAPLSVSDRRWLYLKSILLWLYIVLLSTPVLFKAQSIWIIAYFIVFLFWCVFFRTTAVTKYKGFYPFFDDWKSMIFHTILFITGLAGVDMIYLESVKQLTREAVMQYHIIEFGVLWSVFYTSSTYRLPWVTSNDSVIDIYDKYIKDFFTLNEWHYIATLPIIILLLDSVVHYSWVYHRQLWRAVEFRFAANGCRVLPGKVASYGMYFLSWFILTIDLIVRSFLIIFAYKYSSVVAWIIMIAAYLTFGILLWAYALSFGAVTADHNTTQLLKLALKKTGGKLLSALMISLWSVTGLFQILPTIQQSNTNKQLWGINVIRLECLIRLLLSISALYIDDFLQSNEFSVGNTLVYAIMLIFGIYPYAMELLFQSPLAMLCQGSFFMIHHIDALTQLPNIQRFHKDFRKVKWKNGIVYMNIRNFKHLNHTYGRPSGDAAMLKFAAKITEKMEEFATESPNFPILYRFRNDCFAIIVAFTDQSVCTEFVQSLATIRVKMLRPEMIPIDKGLDEELFDIGGVTTGGDENELADLEMDDAKSGDPMMDEAKLNEVAQSGAGALGGGGASGAFGGNWMNEDDDDDAADSGGDAHTSTESKLKKKKSKKRASVNLSNIVESIECGMRVACSFGPFCSLKECLKLEYSLREEDRKERADKKGVPSSPREKLSDKFVLDKAKTP